MSNSIVIALCVPAAILLGALVIVFVRFIVHLNRKVSKIMLDFTGVQSSLSNLTAVVGAVSTEVSTLQAGSDTTADQAQIDSVKTSLDGAVSTLQGLVSTPSTAL